MSPTVTFLGIKNWLHARWPQIKESVSNYYALVESDTQAKMERVSSQNSDHFNVTDNTKKKASVMENGIPDLKVSNNNAIDSESRRGGGP